MASKARGPRYTNIELNVFAVGSRALTSISSTFLQVIYTFSNVAFAHLLSDESCHHDFYPLFSDDGVACVYDGFVVCEVYAVESWWYGGLFGQEGSGFGGRHFGGRAGERVEEVDDRKGLFRLGDVM